MTPEQHQELNAILAKKRPTPAELERARQLLGWNDPKTCQSCNEPVQRDRWCWAVPICFACLPPPPALRTAIVRGRK